jgi:hypothetical protein
MPLPWLEYPRHWLSKLPLALKDAENSIGPEATWLFSQLEKLDN